MDASTSFLLFTIYNKPDLTHLFWSEIKSSNLFNPNVYCSIIKPHTQKSVPLSLHKAKTLFRFLHLIPSKEKKISDFCSFWAGQQLPTKVSHDNTWQASCQHLINMSPQQFLLERPYFSFQSRSQTSGPHLGVMVKSSFDLCVSHLISWWAGWIKSNMSPQQCMGCVLVPLGLIFLPK